MDGTQWDIKIAHGRQKKYARGDNEFPEGFQEFLTALSHLTA